MQSIWAKLNNICCLSDSYKISQYSQYPPGTQFVESYFESRVGAKFNSTVFFALQYYLDEYLSGKVVTKDKINYAKSRYRQHFGKDIFNEAGWNYILNKHDGRLPVKIRAVPEGSVIPTSNVLMSLRNTDPTNCYWLTNILETLLVQVWYGCTVATQSREIKKVILKYLVETGSPELIDTKLHDFGFRGVSSVESSAVGGAAHLLNFKGTDTFSACILAEHNYHADMAGISIPAMEHSTVTSWGQANEVDSYDNMLTQYPTGYCAIVIDSFDTMNAVKNLLGGKLRSKILGRDGVLVFRPDSGDPPVIVVQVLEALWAQFGGTINSKGYRVLNDHVRLIQGDGIDYEMVVKVLEAMKKAKFSADNAAFGSGGGLLQKLNRDTQRFAFKCSSINVNGIERPVVKDPKTDASKRSKSGILKLIIDTDGTYRTVTVDDPTWKDFPDVMGTVFENGKILRRHKFNDIQSRCAVAA